MYMLEENFNHEKFYMSPKSMKLDDRIMKNKSAEYAATVLYDALSDKIGLSKSKSEISENKFINKNGEVYCIFTEEHADNELSMSSRQYKSRKAFLKKAGLIDYEEQDEKAVGNASRITVKPWITWIDENGLLNKGVWIIEPTSKDFYNPTDIVKVQPNIRKGKYAEVEPTEENIAEFNEMMKHAKAAGNRFHNVERMSELVAIVEKHFGVDKKLTEATVKDLNILKIAYEEMSQLLDGNNEQPDF